MKNLALYTLAVLAVSSLLGFGADAALADAALVTGASAQAALTETPDHEIQVESGNGAELLLGNPQPVFMGNTAACDQACQDQLESCLPSCGTSGPTCDCFPVYRACTWACGC